ncbi:MAG: Dabb family protein [Pseudomonadota bacterium]
MIQHIVLCRFREDVSSSEIAAIWQELDRLRDVIPGMGRATFGENTSPEALGRGHGHGFVIEFDTAMARDAYLVHPKHKVAGSRLVAACEGGVDGITVVDIGG